MERNNETIVRQLQNGEGNRNELLDRLWRDNLPLIRKFVHEFINGVIHNTSDITISSGSGWQKVSLDGWVHNETLRIISNAEMKVRYRNSTYTIYTGENIMYDIVLYKGVNDLYFQGTGKVTLIHRGGML